MNHSLSNSRADKRVFRRLLGYTKPHKRALFITFVVLLLATSSDVLGPILIKTFIDGYLTPRYFPVAPLVMLGSGYLLLNFLSVGMNYIQVVRFQTISLHIIQQLRLDVFAKVQKLGLAFFDSTPTGALVSRITNDTEAIKDMYISVLSTFVQSIFLLVGILISLFFLDVRLAALCLLLVPIIYGIMQTYRRVSGKVFHLARQKLSHLNAKLNESLQGMNMIQAMRQQSRLQQEFDGINRDQYLARMKNINYNSLLLRPLTDIVYFVALMGVLWFFGVKSLHGFVEIGIVYVFINYLERFFEPINTMMQRLNLFQQAMVASERVFELLDEDAMAPTVVGTEPATIEDGLIQFKDVSFSYDGKTEVLKNISFTAHPGQTVALVGHTGSGKSSIVNLLMRFYTIDSGQILIDGQSLQTFEDEELRRNIGLVLQEPFLFTGDIKRNIRLGNPNISDTDVVEAAQFVQADGFIRQLPEGYDEPVSERGATFSSGQRQLLSFARTMAIQPKVLVLDEATASIDTETEEAIQTALAKMRLGRTTIAIAHRLSTIQDADLILVLHQGEIIERGNHQQLLEQLGLYHKMYLLQQGAGVAVEQIG